MIGRTKMGLMVVAAVLGVVAQSVPVLAQIPAVIVGRVEDSATRTPLAGVRVSAGSTFWTLTDSTGAFSLEVADGDRVTLHVEGLGFLPDSFDLADGASSRVSVLLLEPAPLELAGIDVEAEAALARVLTQLENRRSVYPYSVAAYQRDAIGNWSSYGDAWAFLRARLPDIYECTTSRSGLCVGDPVMAHDFSGPFDQAPQRDHTPLEVCIDGIESTLAIQELRALGMHRLSLLEVYRGGRGGVRLYSAEYLRASARAGGVYIAPTHTWGAPGNTFSGRC